MLFLSDPVLLFRRRFSFPVRFFFSLFNFLLLLSLECLYFLLASSSKDSSSSSALFLLLLRSLCFSLDCFFLFLLRLSSLDEVSEDDELTSLSYVSEELGEDVLCRRFLVKLRRRLKHVQIFLHRHSVQYYFIRL